MVDKVSQLQICKDHAIGKGGLCLSDKYQDNKTNMLWKCSCGHEWPANWGSIKNQGSWCYKCVHKANGLKLRSNIKEAQYYAKLKGGVCLSEEYVNNNTKMLWKCSEGHEWEAVFASIKHQDSWCIICAKHSKPDIKELQDFALSKNGKLISTEYISNKESLLWRCSYGHEWYASWTNISHNDTWCPQCANNIKHDIQQLQEFALSKNGKLLSTTYTSCMINDLIWQCEEGHTWNSSWYSIKNQDTWCPKCACFKTERRCREILEQKLGIEFKKNRFYYDELNNRKFIELDGYNFEKNIGFEYNGYQHYIYPNHYHKTKQQFLKAQLQDAFKEQYCAERDIKLLIIPYTEENNLEKYIDGLLEEIRL